MKVTFIVQALALSFFISGCSKTKTRAKTNNSLAPQARAQNGTELPGSQAMQVPAPGTSFQGTPIQKTVPGVAANIGSGASPVAPVKSPSDTGSGSASSSTTKTDTVAPPSLIETLPVGKTELTGLEESQKRPATAAEKAAQKNNSAEQGDDNEAVKKADTSKISFKDIEKLKKISDQRNDVLYKGKIIPYNEAMQILINGDEDNFCQVSGAEKFHAEDWIKLLDGGQKPVDAANDIHRTTLIYGNKYGKLIFSCTHTTTHFYMEEMRSNFSEMLTLYGLDGSSQNHKEFVNYETEDRLLHAIRIENLETFNKIRIQDKKDEKDLFAIMDGKVMQLTEAYSVVDKTNALMACAISDVIGEIDTKKIFMQVQVGIAQDTPKEMPNAQVFYSFMADRDTGFLMLCEQKKRASVSTMFQTAKGLFKFGQLNRKEYKKRKAELEQIQKELTEALEKEKQTKK